MECIPKISVIAPCLNEASNLHLFLRSLELQTCQQFELIIIDGGSEDGSVCVLRNFGLKVNFPIKVFIDKTRNFGYLRNLGTKHAKGEIVFQTSVDTYFEPHLLKKIVEEYDENPNLLSLAGRTFPLGTSVIAHLGYQLFDLLRFLFTCYPMPIRKFRPSGNFTTFRREAFDKVGGYPHVSVNEDGLMGQRLDLLAKNDHKAVAFRLNLYVGHRVKKFEKMGGIRAILFYFYTLGNFAPLIQPLLEPVRRQAAQVFEGKKEIESTSMKLQQFWDWL